MDALRIGDWRADPRANELRRGPEVVRIEPKAMEVLVLLAGRAGELVGREELLAAAWPGVVVGDEALTQCVIKLRRALADEARSPRYIETISKRGYRLIAPAGPWQPDPPPAAPAARPARRRDALVALALCATLAAGAYALWPAPAPFEPDLPRAAGERESLLTVALVPFESVGEDRAQAYLARGIAHDLGTALARLPGLRLIAPAQDERSNVARARYEISGSVQRQRDDLRINIRIVDTESGRQLWSERFERPFAELFQVQDEMLRRLAEVLPGKLAESARQEAARRYTDSVEAYDLFLRAQARFLRRQAEENEAARALYRKALAVDPRFARAYAGLAMTYAMEYRLRPEPDEQLLGRARELAGTAALIDPQIAEVHWALAFVHVQGRRHDDAMRSLNKAIELNRSFADAYAFLGGIQTYVGQPSKSVPLLRTAMRLNPDAGYLYYLLLGRAYLFQDDTEQALLNLREAAARNPVDMETRIYLSAAMAAAGDAPAAQWEADQIAVLHEGFSTRRWIDSYPLTSTRHRALLLSLLDRAGLQP
jgi:DNA-binding winged helix-turn-helix (wHTH) protein/TolB-like protein/Flp pilus assembly protein TadD